MDVIRRKVRLSAPPSLVLSHKLRADARPRVARLLQEARITTIPFGEPHWRAAALNYGDCLTYAVARLADRPLLFVGDDFGRTDLAVA